MIDLLSLLIYIAICNQTIQYRQTTTHYQDVLLSVFWVVLSQVGCWHIALLRVTDLNEPPLSAAYSVMGTQQSHHLPCTHTEFSSVLGFKVIQHLQFRAYWGPLECACGCVSVSVCVCVCMRACVYTHFSLNVAVESIHQTTI